MRRWKWMALGSLVAVVAVIGRSYADDDSDRQSLLNDIQRLLNDAASDLDGVASDSSTSDIESARSRVREVKTKLSALERVKGSAATANKYVSDYPRLCDDFERAAQYLVKLKGDQRSVSEQARRCQDLERPLVEKANEMEREKDGARIEELRRLALDVGGKAEDWWRDVEQKKSEMQGWASNAQQFSASDAWSGLTSKIQYAATGMMASWQADYVLADAACKDLRQRDRHPVIDRALRELASTAQGKDQLYVHLDEKLKRIEGLFRDVFGDSSTSKVDEALSTMREIDALVRQVDAVKGADRKAKHIAEQWPSYITAFDASTGALRGLKHTQRELDTAEPRCKTDEDDLREAMKKALASRDPDALVEIPALAQKHGAFFTQSIKWMEERRTTTAGLLATVNAFDPRDDRWGPLKASMQAAARALFDYREEQVKRIHSVCDNLAKGERHPEVETFLRELGALASNDLATYQKEGAAWEADARGIYVLDCKDMQELWDAWCAVEFEPNEEPEDSLVEQKTAEIIDKESRLIDGVLARVPALVEVGKKLAAKTKYRDGANAVLQEIEKHRGRLEKLKSKNGNWRGNNNPASQFANTYGRAAHDGMGRKFSCNLYDQAGIPGLSKDRPDCVVVRGRQDCWVLEFKPQGWAGEDKLPKYTERVTSYYQGLMRQNQDPPSELGGPAFQALVEANCRKDYSKEKKDAELYFDRKQEPYDRCAQRYQCEQ
jgi:DNA repair ATPase RecN